MRVLSKRADGEETKRKIVLEALDLFVCERYHGTSITDIMSKVGLT
jgi:AcrR family transcriptional regulator